MGIVSCAALIGAHPVFFFFFLFFFYNAYDDVFPTMCQGVSAEVNQATFLAFVHNMRVVQA